MEHFNLSKETKVNLAYEVVSLHDAIEHYERHQKNRLLIYEEYSPLNFVKLFYTNFQNLCKQDRNFVCQFSMHMQERIKILYRTKMEFVQTIKWATKNYFDKKLETYKNGMPPRKFGIVDTIERQKYKDIWIASTIESGSGASLVAVPTLYCYHYENREPLSFQYLERNYSELSEKFRLTLEKKSDWQFNVSFDLGDKRLVPANEKGVVETWIYCDGGFSIDAVNYNKFTELYDQLTTSKDCNVIYFDNPQLKFAVTYPLISELLKTFDGSIGDLNKIIALWPTSRLFCNK